MKLPRCVSVVEVGPRDGLQNEPFFLNTELKVALINHLIKSGFKRIEATSFVHPRWIPQLKDAEELIKSIVTPPDVRISALVPNYKGYQRAMRSGIKEINIVLSVSETHNMKNVNRSVDQSLRDFQEITGAARRDGILVRGSVATSFGCPYEGSIPLQRVRSIVSHLWEMGCFEIVLADTTGCANPLQVYNLFSDIREKNTGVLVAAHFHDTRGMGMANVLAALGAGVLVFDSSIGGMGGCPYAPGASGNIATEDLVNMLCEMDVETGINLNIIRECVDELEKTLKCRVRGHMSGLWKNTCDEPAPS